MRRAAVFGDELEAIRVDLECREHGEDEMNGPPSGYEAISQGTATVVPRSAWGEGVHRASFVFTDRPEEKASRAWRLRAADGADLLYRFTFIYRDGWSTSFPVGGGFAQLGADRVLRVGEPYTFSVLVLPALRLPEDAERLDVRLMVGTLGVAADKQFAIDHAGRGESRRNIRETARNIVAGAAVEPRFAANMDQLNANPVPFPFGGIIVEVDLEIFERRGEHERAEHRHVADQRLRRASFAPLEQLGERRLQAMPDLLDLLDIQGKGVSKRLLRQPRSPAPTGWSSASVIWCWPA